MVVLCSVLVGGSSPSFSSPLAPSVSSCFVTRPPPPLCPSTLNPYRQRPFGYTSSRDSSRAFFPIISDSFGVDASCQPPSPRAFASEPLVARSTEASLLSLGFKHPTRSACLPVGRFGTASKISGSIGVLDLLSMSFLSVTTVFLSMVNPPVLLVFKLQLLVLPPVSSILAPLQAAQPRLTQSSSCQFQERSLASFSLLSERSTHPPSLSPWRLCCCACVVRPPHVLKGCSLETSFSGGFNGSSVRCFVTSVLAAKFRNVLYALVADSISSNITPCVFCVVQGVISLIRSSDITIRIALIYPSIWFYIVFWFAFGLGSLLAFAPPLVTVPSLEDV
ncbi:uncharacterized protein LOC9319908 [Arabidopsis lyrata subsp. lyrata]|uniref:uncharacterized protein LOC9319908 n=1 Tax=Arabidopsis lyrata subsp. lyrata TaxID=81972 RepID=UPI000A29B306|nr:uncharacterized protein LOC9319908 [Arabidopsis lyrata subsp. lyrata]|eukprot:XP_020888126.1 uncharacterized protein LOC9319908 [Arabidopsis lyrata subsp. lyrata]